MKYLIALNILLMLGIYFYTQQAEPVEEEAVVVSKAENYPDDLAQIEIVLQKQYLDGRRDTETYT